MAAPPTRSAMLLGLPDATRLRLRPGAILPHERLVDSVMLVIDGALVVSVAPRPGRRSAPARPWRPQDGTCIALLGPDETWLSGPAAAAATAPSVEDPRGSWAAPRRTSGSVAFEARAVAPSLCSLAPLTTVTATLSHDPLTWVALLDAAVETGMRMAARLSVRSLPVRERVRRELSDIARRFGRDTPRGRRIALPLNQDLLADLVGATRESVNRALGELGPEIAFCRADGSYVVAAGASAFASPGSA